MKSNITKHKNKISENCKNVILEQYKIFVESADRISAKRLATNSFFVSLNIGIIALISFFTGRTNEDMINIHDILFSIYGFIVNFLWLQLIKSYRNLNEAKYNVVHQLEKKLPVQPYNLEWDILNKFDVDKRYIPLTKIEIAVPAFFCVIHLLVLVYFVFTFVFF